MTVDADAQPARAVAPDEAWSRSPRSSPMILGSALVVGALAIVTYGIDGRGVIAAVASVALVLLAGTDIEHRVLPNRLLFTALVIVLGGRLIVQPNDALAWLLAGPAAALFVAAPLLVRRDAVGMGDIKLCLLLGATVGWQVFGAIAVGCLLIAPVAAVMLVRDRTLTDATLPFGPFLAFGTLVVLLTGS